MAKKKLLNEVQVRRFMGLAGLGALSENIGGLYEEEPEMDAEEPEMDAEEPEMDDLGEPEAAEEPEMDAEAGEEEVSVTKDTIDAAGDALMDLLGQLGYEGGGEAPAPEMDFEEPALEPEPEEEIEEIPPEAEEEEEEVMEALSGVDVELNEDELVQEIAKRVAKRIVKAKQAKKQLDEALGNRKRKIRRK